MSTWKLRALVYGLLIQTDLHIRACEQPTKPVRWLIKSALQVQTSRKTEGPIHSLVEYHHRKLYSYHPDICKLLVSNQ